MNYSQEETLYTNLIKDSTSKKRATHKIIAVVGTLAVVACIALYSSSSHDAMNLSTTVITINTTPSANTIENVLLGGIAT